MDYYETLKHGMHSFPIGIHDTSCGNGFELYPHIHREFEFLVMQKGSGLLSIDDRLYRLNAGEGIFINSCELHVGIKENQSASEFFAVVFAPEIFGSMGDDLIINNYILPVMAGRQEFSRIYSPSMKWQQDVLALLTQLHQENGKASLGFELKMKHLLLELWRLCFIHSSKNTSVPPDPALENIKKAIAYIQEEYAAPLTLEELARCANLSQGYFCRRFSEIVHMTPFEYLLRIRIEKSCSMLLNTPLPVGEISQQCGFNSFSYFSKLFKQLMGCTPREYKGKF